MTPRAHHQGRTGRNLISIVGSASVGILLLVVMALIFLKRDLLMERKHMTRHLVESAYSLLEGYHALEVSGQLSREQAQQAAIVAIRGMRFGGEDGEYFWINDFRAKMVMHPTSPELNGKDISEYRDANGTRLFVEFTKKVRNKGSGFVFYYWPKPGSLEPVRKLSYVVGFEPWGWIVGSGTYIDDLEALFWRNARIYGITGAGILLLIFWLSLALGRKITADEEALKISEEKFFKAFDACPDGISITRMSDGFFIEANEALLRILGYSHGEVIGRTSLELNVWVDPQARRALLEKTEREGAIRDEEVLLRRKDGTLRVILWASEVIKISGESCFLTILKDITQQKENQRQLLESKAEITRKHEELSSLFDLVRLGKRQWEMTFDCIQDLVILLDGEGRIKRCNRAVAGFTGMSYGQILERDWRELFTLPEISTDTGCFEFHHESTDRWLLIGKYAYRDNEAGAPSGTVITIHDTTERKRAALELEDAYTKLKEAHSQMLHREKMASIGQLAAGVAHEINNPVGYIMSNLGSLARYAERIKNFVGFQSEILDSHAPPEVQADVAARRKQQKIDYLLADLPSLVAESLDGAERVKKIVQDLKSFSRVDDEERKLVAVSECLDSTINIIWNELKYKATLQREYGEVPMVKCYPQQLNQVFMNLLVNAAHAIEKEGEIKVCTWADDDSVYVAISDSGCGINESVRSRIFDPFFTTKEVGQGTGLGLSISYDIIKKHGGEITVDSVVGKGSTFTLRLPASR